MKNKMNYRIGQMTLVGVCLLLLALLVYQQRSGPAATAAGPVEQAWDNVRRSSNYAFDADVVIETIPLPTTGNIGRFSKTDSLFLEGRNDLQDDTLEMALWGGGVSVANRDAAYQMRVRDGRPEVRTGAGKWQSTGDSTVAFAPEGDFLAFLDVATNVALASDRVPSGSDPACAALDCSQLAVYTFDLDSRAYAAKLAGLAQEQMIRSGQLPPGASVQMPEHLAGVTGSGELWVDARGLPVRQKVTLAIPAAEGADSRSEAEMDIRFTNYQGYPGAQVAGAGLPRLAARLSSLDLPSPADLGLNLGLLSLVLLAMAVVARPNRRTRSAITVGALAVMVLVQPLQTLAVSAASERMSVQKVEQAAAAETRSAEQSALDLRSALRAAPPYTPPAAALDLMAPAAARNASADLSMTTLDTDADGLTDAVEEMIGTNPFSKDSDFDDISDFAEVAGFSHGGRTWYGNPLWADSNGDGALDSLEWKPTAPDSDGDGLPDLYDFDDDGDSVPDDLDISRLAASKDNAGNLVAFSQATPLDLTIDGLQANRYTYVNVQLRPTNPDQLWYAFNVLDWPKDQKGNMQDWDGKTLFDHCQKTGGADCTMTPDANGDIKLVPMLEVALPDLSSLPRTGSGALDEALLEKYGISVQPAGNGGYFLYVPLNLVEDATTGGKVAFSAQLLYQAAAAAWQPQQVRLSWGVQVLSETYASPEEADKALAAGGGFGNNQQTILHAYYSDFYLTGLDVREDRGVDMAIVYEDPATDPDVTEDDALVHMTTGLDSSFLINRDCDFVDNDGFCVGDGQRDITIPVIKQRWDRLSNSGTTSGQRWGIAQNRLRVETRTFAHEDEATMVGGGEVAPAILDAHFTGTAATKASLLFVRQARFRATNVDVRTASVPAAGASVAWIGRNVRISLTGVAEMITGGYVLSPYQYVSATASWARQTPQDVVGTLESRYPLTGSGGAVVPLEQQSATVVVTISAMQGNQAVLSQNGPAGLSSALTANGAIRLQAADIRDEDLRLIYVEALAAIGRIVPYLAKDAMTRGTGLSEQAWTKLSNDLFESVRKKYQLGYIDKDVRLKYWNELKYSKGFNSDPLIAQTNRYRQAMVGPALVLYGIGFFLTNVKGAQTAGEIMLSALTAAESTIEAVSSYRTVQSVFKTLPLIDDFAGSVQAATLRFSHSLTSSAAKAGAVGAALGLVATWAFFFAAWGKGGLSTDSVAFNALLAGAIAMTLVLVLTFFISLSVVGAIVLAVFAIFDLIALIICKAGVKAACSLGITEAITKLITEWLYTGSVMIDTNADPSLTNIDDATMRLTNPEQGLVVGNGVRFDVTLLSVARHAAPEPGIIYHYDNFYTAGDLRSTTAKYTLDTTERKLPADLNQTTWYEVRPYDVVEAEVPSPVVGWLVPTVQSKTLYQGARFDRLSSGVYPFSSAKRNLVLPLYLNTGLALPRYDCWFQICVHKSAKSSVSTDLGKQFVLDILPATLNEFVVWTELGQQIDPDGDGLSRLVDPNQTKWDTDGDGLPDGVEYEFGIERGYGFNPIVADADNDGLNDALEMRYGTDPRKADTDGDGIADLDEINGYQLTFGSRSVHVTTNPIQRDSDLDGMSDSVERRLNGIDSTRYPFHPQVFNDSPVRIYSGLDDDDRVLAVGASAIVSTTVINGTAVENALLAAGVFSATLPAPLGSATQTRSFTLLPSSTVSIVQNGTAAAANGVFNVTTGVEADLVPVGTTPAGPPDDIILGSPLPVTIDSDQPAIPALTAGSFVQPGYTVIIGGTASDPTSYVSRVDVQVGAGAFAAATGASAWAFPVDIPNTPTGSVPITVRAADAVNNTRSANFNLTIDGVAPALAVDLSAGAQRRVQRNADGDWTLSLSGTAADALAGIDSVTVQIGASSSVVITPTAIATNGSWSLDYPFDDISFNADPSPTGPFTLTVTARDTALPEGNPNTQVIPFVIDMTPPTVDLLSHQSDEQLTDGAVITGTVQDAHAAVASVEYALVDAATAFETEETLLHLGLNDLPETVLFRNNANEPARIFCLDESCPTSGVAGTDGTAASFDGVDDMLRSFETLDLPESGLTTALWFKTTNANAGLFSAVAGQFPTLTGHDRDIYLAAGKVCVDVKVGGSAETRCSVGSAYADGLWHQAVHTLGAGGNALYIDGALAVSSPTSASTFTAQDRLLVGYAAAAGAPYFAGALDDVIVYDGQLSAGSVAALYRRWQPATLAGGQWSFTIPTGLEGYTQIDMRATDSAGNRVESRGDWPQFRGPIDTKFPTFDVSAGYAGAGSSALTLYGATVRDYNLTSDNYDFVCSLTADQLRYLTDPVQLQFAGVGTEKLAEIVAACTAAGFQTSLVAATACDSFGHCAAATPSQSVAYLGTTQNTLYPFGSLPNAIERANLSDPRNRVRLLERPGKVILDIAVDELHGMLYWAEMAQGDYAQPAGVWRANLDGSSPQQVVGGLTAYGAEALQIAVDPAGNKLYWTKGYQLWWSNLDGTLQQVVYAIPDDPRYIGGGHELMDIGDVAVDGANGKLYLTERRQRGDLAGFNSGIRDFGRIFKHTLIVVTDLNGANPSFFAGAGVGCTYANFYDNLGAGVGAGTDPTLCLTSGSDGFDVEAMAMRDGTLTWTAIDADGVNSGVYGRTPGSPPFTVAPLAITGNSNGLRTGPLPQVYVDPAGAGVFVSLDKQIVRGERGGEFTQFTSFVDNTPAPAGGSRRSSSTLSAMTVIETDQDSETDTDLAVDIKSPSLVVVNGGVARYDITLRNDAALPAADTVLTLALPTGASFAGSTRACTSGGVSVTCNFGRFDALIQQSVGISFTISTSTVRDLTATATVASSTAERNPANNIATHTRITAAPTLAALPGLPYIYYGNLEYLIRVPLYGPTPFKSEPLFLDPPISGQIIAADAARNKLFIITALDRLIAVNPDGSGRVEIADANAAGLDSTARLRVAVDDATGRVYWSEIASLYLTTIKSANPDGSDVQTVISNVVGQRGLLVDPIRRKLLWVGRDQWQRQELIFRSDLNGANSEVVYAAPEGMQVRELAIDPYSQKLYWLDPTAEDGALFWADSDGGRLAALATGLGGDARGLVVRPFEDALYYVSGTDLMRAELDGSNPTQLADLSQRPYTGLRLPVSPTTFTSTWLNRPQGNLAFVMGTPFAAPPCVTNDGFEPNNSVAAAAAIAAGSRTAALCVTDTRSPQDIDYYTLTVPDGKQLDVTLSSLPADYGLYVQRAGLTLATSLNTGLADETISLPNYDGDGAYVIVVFSAVPVNNSTPYTLQVGITDAPYQITNAQCLAVDPSDAVGTAGNYIQSQATSLTLGSPATGALCYTDDIDFYAFDAAAGQTLSFDLPLRPAPYELHVYRPDGSFFNAYSQTGAWTYPAQVTVDATGRWAVAVRMPNLVRTTDTYQLLVSDDTCGINDSWEPNNTAGQAAALGTAGRVFGTLCDTSDADYFTFSATSGQQITLNYPANAAGGALRLLNADGVEQGRVQPGSQGIFVLAAGSYMLATSNAGLAGSDAPYMFQWLLDVPQPAADSYVYYTDGLAGQLYRVALSADHTAEPIFLSPSLTLSGEAVAADRLRGTLFSYNSNHGGDGFIARNTVNPFDGGGYTIVVGSPNPDGVGAPPVAIAVDELTGRIYWVQPQGGSASLGSTIRSATADGADVQQVVGSGIRRTSLAVDSIQGHLYWTEDGAIKRSNLDGSSVQTIRAAVPGQDVRDLALDPYAARLYWIDSSRAALVRANADASGEAVLISGLDANARGVAVQPLRNALFYSSGSTLFQALLDGSSPVAIAQLSGAYQGPSNLDPGSYPQVSIAAPASALVLGGGAPIVSPCTLADDNEPNNDAGSATPLALIDQTVAYGALCNSVLNQPPDWDFFRVTVADQKTLGVTLSEMPANYRVIVRNEAGLNLAFSDNDGLADEVVSVSNTSGAAVDFIVLVGGYGFQNTNQYKLTLDLGDVPPPPDPTNDQCGFVDIYDAPAPGGNGTLASATPLTLTVPMAAALCYADDVDMYAFAGVAGQGVTIDLPIRPADYSLTLYDPGGASIPVSYGATVLLSASGSYTVSVSQPGLVPTTSQYQLVVKDENCLASDANEPNNTAGAATLLANGSRARATLCSGGDVDVYRVGAAAGQELTLNYPANATGATLRVGPAAGGGDLGTVSAGGQGIFTIPAGGDYLVTVENNAMAGSAVPYQFELLLGSPNSPPGGSPYIYYSRASDLIRTAVVTGTVEPILLPDGFVGGSTLAADTVRGQLYILDNFERIVRVNPDGSSPQVVVADTGPGVLRFTESLAVDERSGRIYWTQATFGVVSNIMSANGDGSDVQTVVTDVVYDHGLAVDPVGGRLYWVQNTVHNGAIVDHIRRSNLDGSDQQTVYAAPEGREIRDLAVDPFAQTLTWHDPTQNQLLQTAADGGGDAIPLAEGTANRGLVVRPLLDELLYTAGSELRRSELDGANPSTVALLEGEYNGVSNLDPGVFYPTVITPPGSNLAVVNSTPFAQPCAAVDGHEPNDTLATAAAITPGTLSAALCTASLAQPDQYDYYKLTIDDGKQITVTLTDLPLDYSLVLIADGSGVGWSYQPGTADEVLTHANRTGAPVVYSIMVGNYPAYNDSRLPYTLVAEVGDAPPPPPPPPPPGDACAPFDVYDQPGVAGNQTRQTATLIGLNTPITAALCYGGDKDWYAFDGVVGQNVTLNLSPRPADYSLAVYDPNGQYVAGIFPGSSLTYGQSVTLSASGRWTVAVWDPYLAPTTDQYTLQLGVNTACSGLDPYEPNNEQFSPYTILTRTLTLDMMLCETGDADWYAFPVTVGDRVHITPRVVVEGMRLIVGPPGGGFGEFSEPVDEIMRNSGEFLLAVYPPQNNVTENLPYEIDVQIDAPPPWPPTPNNWTCTVYPSSDVPGAIDDLATLASTVTVPDSGTVTHVGLRDITFNHGGLYDLSFGLAAPDGSQVDLFAFEDYNFYVWCGEDASQNPLNCRLSLDDRAIEGLAPPQFPNDGGTFRPSRSSFAPFEGKASNGTWSLFVSDDGLSDPGGDGGDTTGDLFGWSLEVCVDNGLPPDPTPTPTPSPTPIPTPGNGAPPGATAPPVVVPTPTPIACTPVVDPFEDDDTRQTASVFDVAGSSSAGHTFDRVDDADWQQIELKAGLRYTVTASTTDAEQVVTLSLFEPDGVTLVATNPNGLSVSPTESGVYTLRATSGSGLGVSLCRSGYDLVLVSRNPNAVPVPAPVGTPLPPGHAKPPRSAAVLQPATGLVLTQIQPIPIEIGLNAEDTVQSAKLFANGVAIDSYPTLQRAPASDFDVVWQTGWTPSQAGLFDLTVVITDSANLTATSPVQTFYVDLANPAVSITAETITVARLNGDGAYLLRGVASDDSQVAKVEVRLDGGPWQEAALDSPAAGGWTFPVAPLALANPDGGSLAIEARATDKAGRTANASASVVVDVVPPAAFESTTTLISSGAIISPTLVTNELGARLAWPAIGGAAAVHAGWTTVPTATLASLTSYGPAAGSHDQTMLEARAMYAHVVAVDAHGNQTAVSRGPYYFDSAATPDLIADLGRDNWVDAGGKQVGQMATAERGVQRLFAGWDAQRLRLRWQGLNPSSDGDLYLYLGAGGSGTTDLYNPYGPSQNGVLPFTADYLVRVSSGITPTLYAFSGGTWVAQTELVSLTNGALTDLLLPFADLGIASPAGAALKLLGVASESNELDVWATIPDKNLGQPWNQYVRFNSLGAGIVPAAGVWADAHLEVVVSANPSPAQLVGAGDTVNVTVAVRNAGSAELPYLTVHGVTTGGLVVTSTPQVASSIAPSGTASLSLSSIVTADGALMVTLGDSYHRTYQLETLSYTVDSAAPVDVGLVISYVVPFTNTVVGFAQDGSSLSSFEVEVASGRAMQSVVCDVNGPVTGGYPCEWNAGNAANGASFTLRARATDVHGNTSGWSVPIQVEVDTVPPVLTLSPATLAALSDGLLNARELTLGGTVTDNRAPGSARLCSDTPNTPCAAEGVLPDGSWALAAPDLGDGVTTDLGLTGYDLAGNASQPMTETVVIDTVAPSIVMSTASQVVPVSAIPATLTCGTVTDGFGVAGVQVFVVRPDGSSAIVAASLAGAVCTVQFVFDQIGEYQALVVVTDSAGNQSKQLTGPINVTNPLAVTLAGFSAVQQGDRVMVSWETTSELDNLGFNLYRGTSAAGPLGQLNETLIPSQAPGSTGGFVYTWDDRADLTPGTSYFYWVEDVDISGAATRHGPVSVDYVVPTAVTLDAMEASAAAAGSAMPLAGTMLVLLVLFAGALALRRRRRLEYERTKRA